MLIAILIPSVLSILTMAANMIFGYLKEKRNKDDIAWETAKAIVLKSEDINQYSDKRDAEEVAAYFNYLYRFIKMVEVGKFDEYWKSEKERRLQGTNL